MFAPPLSQAMEGARSAVEPMRQEIYSVHAPEVERIGKGAAHRSYEFGVTV